MAEGWARYLKGDMIEAYSGFESRGKDGLGWSKIVRKWRHEIKYQN